MANYSDIGSLVGQRVIVGLSTITGVTLAAGQSAVQLKILSGSSLEIGGASLTWGAGYLLGVNEVISLDMNGTFYLAATGATVVACVLKGRTQGIAVS